ncbi:copper chaperone PCu(A)C [Phenylobacterium aquaticum]|uniref:copper chaperone PCu(A)C n=1 Tax=Phenylobacterium aquaticum TaxID=1763816 RepID=UPI0026EC691A|nr:copper chaperone PCu(A)C [Phenylobacterium aquaticum]
MRSAFPAAFAATAVLLAPAAHAAAKASAVEVVQPWSRPAAVGTNGAGFMTLTNHGKAPETLMSVETPAATQAQMHQTSMAGGIMSMKRLDAGLALAPGQTVTFAPGGYHLMLIGLTKALNAGDKVPATLVFASGARIKIAFLVGSGPQAPGAMPMDMPMDHMRH